MQVRRGADRAEIYSLAFSNNLQYLAVSSDKGTIHVFNLKINVGLTTNDKPLPAPDADVPHMSPSFSFIKGKFLILQISRVAYVSFAIMRLFSVSDVFNFIACNSLVTNVFHNLEAKK